MDVLHKKSTKKDCLQKKKKTIINLIVNKYDVLDFRYTLDKKLFTYILDLFNIY